MWDFIKYILRLLFEGAIGGFGFALATRFYIKMFIDPKSNLNYDKLIQKVQSWYFQIQIALIFALVNVCKAFGLIKVSDKKYEEFITMILVIILAVAFISKLKFNENKKTELA